MNAPEKLWRWCKRKPALAGTGAIAVLAVALGFGGVVWQLQRVEAQPQRADAQLERTDVANFKLEIQQAESLLGAGNVPSGLALLARIVRQHPTNQLVAERLFSALNQRSFPLPVTPPLEHQAAVRDAQFSPVGLRVVTASEDKTARVWDTLTGKPVTKPLNHGGTVHLASFSPDGRWVLTASNDKTARVWDAQTGEPVGTPLLHEDHVICTLLSLDGKRVVTASKDNTARVWEADSGHLLTTVKHGYWVLSAEFSPDGQRIATASADSTARIWNARTGEPITPPLVHESWVQQVHFSPDRQRIATCSTAADARIWDAQTGRPLGSPIREEETAIMWSAQFNPDGRRLLTISDSIARVWDSPTGEPLTGPLKHSAKITSAEFSADGLLVLTASQDKTAVIWDAHTGLPLCQPIRQRGAMNRAHFSPDRQRVVTASSDKTARVWDVRHGQPLPESILFEWGFAFAHFGPDGQTVLTAAREGGASQWLRLPDDRIVSPLTNFWPVLDAKYSPNGRHIVTISESAKIWDVHTLQPLTESFATISNRAEPMINSVGFSSDGKRIVTTSPNNTANIWEVPTGKPVAKPLQHEGKVNYAQFSKDDQTVVTASGDGTARVWNAVTGEPLTKPLVHDARVNRAKFSPEGKRVVTASLDETARVWEVSTGKELFKVQHDSDVVDAEFSPDGRRILTASLDTTARLWDARTGQTLGYPLKHNGRVSSAHFSPDCERVITASADRTVRLWSARTGQPLSDPFTYNDRVNSAEFSPDGEEMVVASNHSADIWEIPRVLHSTPDWLPTLAESLVGQRVTENGLVEPTFRDELLKLKDELTNNSRKDIYSRWAKWFFADRSTRKMSAGSRLMTEHYVMSCSLNEALSSIRESARLWPKDGVFHALARVMLDEKISISNTVEEAELLSRRAVQMDSTDIVGWATWAGALDRSGQLSESLTATDRALQLKPASHPLWNAKGLRLMKTNRLEEAYQCFSNAIAFKDTKHEASEEQLAQYHLHRGEVLKQMGRLAQAGEDNLKGYGISQRDPQAKPELLDLSPFYNVNFTNDWEVKFDARYDGLNFSPGIHRLAGVDFDVRGVIQVAPSAGHTKSFSKEVSGIPVGHSLARIHFLHAAIGAELTETNAVHAGSYVIHNADGQEHEIPLRLGKELADWWLSKPEDAEVAWTGSNTRSASNGKPVQLFKFTWQNPRPKVEVRSLDLISALTNAAPFVVAITVE